MATGPPYGCQPSF
ncbi:hypothetical protein EC5905_2542, partial [Escherichia coli 5905]